MGALIAGSVIGAIPAIIGAAKGKLGRGLFALFTCVAAGVMGGMLFALSVAAIFTYFICKKSPEEDEDAQEEEDTQENDDPAPADRNDSFPAPEGIESSFRYCPACGKRVEHGSLYCSACGKKLS